MNANVDISQPVKEKLVIKLEDIPTIMTLTEAIILREQLILAINYIKADE